MREITRIVTAEFTTIIKESEGNQPASKEDAKKAFEAFFKKSTDLDDCVVTNVQDFELDVPEE